VKTGLGIFSQQYVARDLGVFSRAMISDGNTEVDAYTSADRSLSFGMLAKGSLWSRPRDLTGVGGNLGWYIGLGASQESPWPSKRRLRAEVANLQAESAQAQSGSVSRVVIEQLKVAYFKLAYLRTRSRFNRHRGRAAAGAGTPS
jgi:hypothetical protein